MFQTHYVGFFKDKTDKDKALLVAEYMSAFGRVDDRVFLIAAGDVVKSNKYFPSIDELEEKIEFAKIKEERRQVDEHFKKKNLTENANLTDEQIEILEGIDDMFEGAESCRPDWRKIREEARKEIGGSLCLGEGLMKQNAIEGV